MKKFNFFLLGLIMVLAACQNDKAIEFSGLKHTTFGNAKIHVNKNLFVTNFLENRKDGVSIDLEKPRSWTANFTFKNTNKTELVFNVLGSGVENQPIKSLSEMFLKFESNEIFITAKFATPTNDLKLYRNDSLVYNLIDFPSKTPIGTTGLITHGGSEDQDAMSFGQQRLSASENGACFWQFEKGEKEFALNTEMGQVKGNKLMIAEHLNEGQTIGKMLFQKMNITAGNRDTLIIFSESVEK